MQTDIQKQKAIKLGSVRFDADFGQGYVNLGGLKSAVLNLALNTIQIVLDNAKIPPKIKIASITLSANLYEFDLENIRNITGLGTFSSVDGSPTSAVQNIDSATS
jgi:hypothetical protein